MPTVYSITDLRLRPIHMHNGLAGDNTYRGITAGKICILLYEKVGYFVFAYPNVSFLSTGKAKDNDIT